MQVGRLRHIGRTTRQTFAALSVAVAFLATAGLSQATVIVVPGAQTATEGDSQNSIPFFGAGERRLQQVYAASEFSAFSGPETITGLAFRCDVLLCPTSRFSVSYPSIDIRLSTASAAPDALSGTYSDNVGLDVSLVYTGPLTLSGAGTGGAPGPNPFDIAITLQTGFLYDPTQGNLLLDIINPLAFSPQLDIFLDSQEQTGDSISRVFSDPGQHLALTGTPSTSGLVTQFTTSSTLPMQVPEPGTLVVLSAGLFGLACARRRRTG